MKSFGVRQPAQEDNSTRTQDAGRLFQNLTLIKSKDKIPMRPPERRSHRYFNKHRSDTLAPSA